MEEKRKKKLHQKTRCSLWCCLVLVDSIPNSYSNSVVCFSAPLLVLVSVLFVFFIKMDREMRENFGHCRMVKGVLA